MNTELYEFDETTLQRWQSILALLANIMCLPVALIMRIIDEDIEVFAAHQDDSLPRLYGERFRLQGSKLYCEYVITHKKPFVLPDASTVADWKDSLGMKMGLVAYMGFPLSLPDGRIFGTICVMDNKPNAFSETQTQLLEQFRNVVQDGIALTYMNHELGKENQQLIDYLSEIKVLRGFIPICMHCKRVRDDEGYWEAVECYVMEHSEAVFSHSLCPDCAEKYYRDTL